MKTLLALDLSTNCSGWALYDMKTKHLLKYGILKPKIKGISKMKYPEAPLMKILDMSEKLTQLVKEHNPSHIIIEEVNRGINRIAQKSLDALHFVLLGRLVGDLSYPLKKISYVDSNGSKGWRGKLGMRLSEADKKNNKAIRAANRKAKLKKAVINWKTLACRWANAHFEVKLSTNNNPKTDGDIADAVCIGYSYFI